MIEIRETIDGRSVGDEAPERPSARRSGKSSGGAPQDAPRDDQSASAAKLTPQNPPDRFIWGIYIALLLISIVELFSASSAEISGSNVYSPLIRHCIFLGLGLALVLWIQNIPYTVFSRLAVPLAVVSVILLLLSMFVGVNINGAQRAIRIAGFTIQPPEIIKLTAVILLAKILGQNQKPGGVTSKGVAMAGAVVLILSGLLWVNGLTNMLLMMCVSISLIIIGGIEWRKLGVVFVVYAIAGGALFMIKYATPESTEYDSVAQTEQSASTGAGRQETHKERIERFFAGVHPGDTINDKNRQVIFANLAQANGGLIGQGPGNSRESARLPLAFSDYIYSIVVEDTGFIGGSLLLLLYLFLVARAGVIGYRCSRAFPAFLIMGCAVLIVFQALVHMAIVTGLFPVSGQPLPFISKGGTSILVMSVAIGIMLSVSRFSVTSGDKKAMRAEGDELPDELKAINISHEK